MDEDTIKRNIGLKGGLHHRINRGETQVLGLYNKLARKLINGIRTAKSNYEDNIARDTQIDSERFYQLHKA